MTQRDEIATRAASEAAGRTANGRRRMRRRRRKRSGKRWSDAPPGSQSATVPWRLADALAGAEPNAGGQAGPRPTAAGAGRRVRQALGRGGGGGAEGNAVPPAPRGVDRLKDEHTLRIASLQTGVERAAALESDCAEPRRGRRRRGRRQASLSKLIEAHDTEMRLRAQLTDALATAESARAEVVTLRANEGPAHSALGVLQHQFEALTREKQSQEESLRREVVTLRARCETLEREHREATRTAQHKVAEAEAARAAALYGAQRTEERLTSAEASRHATEQVSHFFWGIVVS